MACPVSAASRVVLQRLQQPRTPTKPRVPAAIVHTRAAVMPAPSVPAPQPNLLCRLQAGAAALFSYMAATMGITPAAPPKKPHVFKPTAGLRAQTLKLQCLKQHKAAAWQKLVKQGLSLERGARCGAAVCDVLVAARQPASPAAASPSSLVIVPTPNKGAKGRRRRAANFEPEFSRFAPAALQRPEPPLFRYACPSAAAPTRRRRAAAAAAASSGIAARTRSKTAAASSSCVAGRTRSKTAAAAAAAAARKRSR